MSVDVEIRPVRIQDAQEIVDILTPIIQAGCYTVLEGPLTTRSEQAYIAAFPVRGVFNVAENVREGRIVGFQSLEPFATYTRAFDHVGVIGTFVALPQRRQGIGRQLTEATFDAAKDLGYEKVFTYVRADNPGSLLFHLKLGFRIVGTAQRQAKIEGAYIDEIIIERFLL